MLKVLQSLCMPGGVENEDALYIKDNIVAVIDGSTSLISTSYKAAQFVRGFLEAFDKRASFLGVVEAVNRALEEVKSDYYEKNTPSHIGYFPSASGIFVYEEGEELCVLSVGDCTANIFLKNNKTHKISDDSVVRFDNGVLERVLEIRSKTGEDVKEIVASAEIKNKLLENRLKMNMKNGYPILAFNMKPVDETSVVRFRRDEVERIVLYSDGFSHFENELNDKNVDILALYEKVRKSEDDDKSFNLTPRFKPSDDCSAIVLEIE